MELVLVKIISKTALIPIEIGYTGEALALNVASIPCKKIHLVTSVITANPYGRLAVDASFGRIEKLKSKI
jgi:hypothetical protein